MFLTRQKISGIGFKSVGENVFISDKASFYNVKNIEIGDNVRIDDFCIFSPGVSLKIGDFVHIGCYTSLIGKGEFILEDFVGISGRVSLYSSSDDYTGMSMTNPMIPAEFKRVHSGKIHIQKHSIIGSGSVILPSVTIGMGCSIYAMSLIKEDCKELGVYSGVPAKLVGERLTEFLKLEKDFLSARKAKTKTINFAKDFSPFPGGRFKIEGPHSGEEFREDILIPALLNFDCVKLNLDGVIGFPPSFVGEAFGRVVEKFGFEFVVKKLKIELNDDPSVVTDISCVMTAHKSL